MKILLDTHTFIWWNSEPTQFSPESLAVLLQPDTVRVVSVVSLWEIQIIAVQNLVLDISKS
jgi:PIN domain nuclease of toxin-antitoxin system